MVFGDGKVGNSPHLASALGAVRTSVSVCFLTCPASLVALVQAPLMALLRPPGILVTDYTGAHHGVGGGGQPALGAGSEGHAAYRGLKKLSRPTRSWSYFHSHCVLALLNPASNKTLLPARAPTMLWYQMVSTMLWLR